MTHPSDLSQGQALAARYALRVSARLSERTEALPQDLSERLRLAREQALGRRPRAAAHRPARAAAARSGETGLWWRLASLAPGVALVAGLVLIQWQQDDELLRVTADIDAALLADDLPPPAYTDPGFAEFLKSSGS